MILCPIHSFKCLLCCRVITCSKSFYVFGSYKVGVGGIFRHQSFIYKFFIHILVNLRRLLPIAKLQFHSIQFNPIFYEESMGQVPLYFSCKLLFRCPDSLSLSLSPHPPPTHISSTGCALERLAGGGLSVGVSMATDLSLARLVAAALFAGG